MSEIIIQNKNELEKLKNDPDKVLMHDRAKFTGFGTYGEYDINDRVNELMKEVKKEYQTIDNYMLWIMVVDYVLKEELKIDIESDEKI